MLIGVASLILVRLTAALPTAGRVADGHIEAEHKTTTELERRSPQWQFAPLLALGIGAHNIGKAWENMKEGSEKNTDEKDSAWVEGAPPSSQPYAQPYAPVYPPSPPAYVPPSPARPSPVIQPPAVVEPAPAALPPAVPIQQPNPKPVDSGIEYSNGAGWAPALVSPVAAPSSAPSPQPKPIPSAPKGPGKAKPPAPLPQNSSPTPFNASSVSAASPAFAVAPSPVAPSPVALSPVAPSPVAPSPVASSPVAPSPVAPSPVASSASVVAPLPNISSAPYVPKAPASNPSPEAQSASMVVSATIASATAAAANPERQSQDVLPVKKDISVTTTTDVVICRKFPDILSAETVPLTVFPTPTKISVNCWTTGSMSGREGKVQEDFIWLRTVNGCYVNEMNVQEPTDFQAKLNYCVSPPHWVATSADRMEPQLCFQCPSLKCPSHSLGVGEYVDVDCLVDGEEARGNNTWIKPVDQNCFLPGSMFSKERWLGTYGGKC